MVMDLHFEFKCFEELAELILGSKRPKIEIKAKVNIRVGNT